MTKKCIICSKEFSCAPSRNIVTCSRECSLKYRSMRRKGKQNNEDGKKNMSIARKNNPACIAAQKSATAAAKKSPKSGRFATNRAAIDWHLIAPDGTEFFFHSLHFWLREHCEQYFDCTPDSKEYFNVISGLSRVKRSMLGKFAGTNQRPAYTYKGCGADK